MRGLIGGVLAGGLVSVVGLGAMSVVSEQPAGVTPPSAPLIEAPQAENVPVENALITAASSTPVGSLMIEEPQAPALPEGEAPFQEPDAPVQVDLDTQSPRADTDPLDQPEVSAIEGAMQAPDAPDSADVIAQPVAPVLPNPQSLPPQTPASEADLTVSTLPAQPTVVVEPDVDVPDVAEGSADFFVVDLGADARDAPVVDGSAIEMADDALQDAAPGAEAEDIALNMQNQDSDSPTDPTPEPRVQLGGANTLLSDRDTGVTIRRPSDDADATEEEEVVTASNALVDFAADAGDVGSKPLMSIILIDDGTMSAAAAALAGLPFAVTIALDPALPNAAALMETYRADGFEVAVMAKLPEGALPSDVEITFESVFSNLPETVAVLDIGAGGLQTDRAVTQQAMNILATQGRGFITTSQGLNMAGRAAEQAGVASTVIFRDLDADGQDARVVRRFIDQAAFRARQESGVILVGRVRPDTISALILWGTANRDDQVAVVPVSAILLAQ